jgi:hypothetical protein
MATRKEQCNRNNIRKVMWKEKREEQHHKSNAKGATQGSTLLGVAQKECEKKIKNKIRF